MDCDCLLKIGILEGLDVLRDGDKSQMGGTLIVVSDGEENVEPHVEDVVDEVRVCGRRLNLLCQ